ncbi:MAG: hypothetical protein Fur0014_20090 [Rubrivivax sp.]
MKTLGLIAGMSRESTAVCYRQVNRGVAALRDHLGERFALDLLPPPDQRAEVLRVIFEELCRGRTEAASRAADRHIIAGLAEAGAEAVILGCTEIGLLIAPGDSPLPAFDTTTLHAAAAVDWICA